ncbi:hypothetical protein PR202_ga20267 [Eleusine coracana subsp. coracana]|uniref:WAC domain-containing protein n=1 Tax=Eleusine coracana subsp. coracana TaxID=191504 RepID=A0AAV5CWB3_ELECO|nr:hypothetical protein PR202_ga20267 [Eleusine coracana subsp. coracana]
MTYTEALACEKRAAEKAQQLPAELIAPVLQTIQHSRVKLLADFVTFLDNTFKIVHLHACNILFLFLILHTVDLCTLSLTHLVEKVYSNLLLLISEGLELYAKKDGSETACKILKVISSGDNKSYEVGWVGPDNVVISTSIVNSDDLIRKKAPVSRNTLKMFIRESTSKSSPWILDANLAKKYGILTELPEDIMVTLGTWADYLCDFMEVMGNEEFSCKLSTVRRGHYGLLETGLKLKILRVLVDEAIATSAVRVEINEQIDQRQAFAAAKREDFRKNRKEYMLNMRGVEENRTNQSDTTQNDTGSYQHGGKEHKDLNSFSTSKTGDGKMYLLDALLGSLNTKGIRERELKRQLSKSYDNISNALEKRMKDVEQKPSREEAVLRRSTRVHAQPKDDNTSMSFLKYINKWKQK